MNRLLPIWLYVLPSHCISAQEIIISSMGPNPICRQNLVTLSFFSTQPLSTGTYEVEFSQNPSGVFTNTLVLGIFNLASLDSSEKSAMITVPGVAPGSCYSLRINRTVSPIITGNQSGCLDVKHCAESVITYLPITLTDPDTACVLSAIDIAFNSDGTYAPGNKYIAQLSDEFGSFANPYVINSVVSNVTYSPLTGAGYLGGLIPRVPAGCNYYIRVISTLPPSTYFPKGPFCIRHCDILTNNNGDIQGCVTQTTGFDTTITFDIHEWDTSVIYSPGNNFRIQVLDRISLNVLSEGELGVFPLSTSAGATLSVPGLDSLPFPPGEFYMRIIADSSSHPWNAKGTLVRLTIGAHPETAIELFANKSLVCFGGNTRVLITLSPYNPASSYEWINAGFYSGIPFINSNSTALFDFYGYPSGGPSIFRVREVNFGCPGPYSEPETVFVANTFLHVNLSGADTVDAGDTASFEASFIYATEYDWVISGGVIIGDSSRYATVRFDSAGTQSIKVVATNDCGTYSDSMLVIVIPRPDTTDTTHNGITAVLYEPLKLYPNPVDDELNISLPGGKPFALFIFDISGKKVMERSAVMQNSKTVVSNLPPGLYFLRIDTAEHSRYGKFVKARPR